MTSHSRSSRGDRPTLFAFFAGRRRVGSLIDLRKHWWKCTLLPAGVPFDGQNTQTVLMHLALLRVIGVAPVREVTPAFTPQDETPQPRPCFRSSRARRSPRCIRIRNSVTRCGTSRAGPSSERGWRTRGCASSLPGGRYRGTRYAGRIACAIDDALDLSGQLSLGTLAAVLSQATLYVGPDTAVTHAAAALGTPTIALYGPSDPVKWGPWPAGYDSDVNPGGGTAISASIACA